MQDWNVGFCTIALSGSWRSHQEEDNNNKGMQTFETNISSAYQASQLWSNGDLGWVGCEDELHRLGDERLPDLFAWDTVLSQLLNGPICGACGLLNLRNQLDQQAGTPCDTIST